MIQPNGNFILKMYTKKELRLLYRLHRTTFTGMLKSLPELQHTGRKNWLSILEVRAIIIRYGIPGGGIYKEEGTMCHDVP